MEWASKGADAMTAGGSAEKAVYYYTRALIEHPYSPDYFTRRAVAFTRLKPQRHDLALRDAEYAVLLGQKRAKREKIQAAQQRRVVALYGLGRYEDAKFLLETTKRWRKTGDAGKSDRMEHDMWMAKIDFKLMDKQETIMHTIMEYPDIDLPAEKKLQSWLQTQIGESESISLDVEKHTATSEHDLLTKPETAASHTDPSMTMAQLPVQKTTLQPIRKDFFQNNDNLIVTFYAKKVEAAKVNCSIEPGSVSISFPHPDDQSSRFTYSVSSTFAPLDPVKSSSKVFGTKVELTLAKAEKGIKWPGLEPIVKVTNDTLPNPYSSKNNSDWDKKAAELTKRPAKAEGNKLKDDGNDSDADSEYGGDAVDGFFKKLYAGADDDTRRAMMKSFQESNGTALSTNWSDVSKKHIDEVKSKDET